MKCVLEILGEWYTSKGASSLGKIMSLWYMRVLVCVGYMRKTLKKLDAKVKAKILKTLK